MAVKKHLKKALIVTGLAVVSISTFQNCGPNKLSSVNELSSISQSSAAADGQSGGLTAGSGRGAVSSTAESYCQPQKVSWTKNGYTCDLYITSVTNSNPDLAITLIDSAGPVYGTVSAVCGSNGSYSFKSGTEVCSNTNNLGAPGAVSSTGGGVGGGTGGSNSNPPATQAATLGQSGSTTMGVSGASCEGTYTWQVGGNTCSTQLTMSSSQYMAQVFYDSRGESAGGMMVYCIDGKITESPAPQNFKTCNSSIGSVSNGGAINTLSGITVRAYKSTYTIPGGDTRAMIVISGATTDDDLYVCVDKQNGHCNSAAIGAGGYSKVQVGAAGQDSYHMTQDFYDWDGIDFGDFDFHVRKRDSSGTLTAIGKATISLRIDFGSGVPPVKGLYSRTGQDSPIDGKNVFKFWCPQGGMSPQAQTGAKPYPYYSFYNAAFPSDGACTYLISK